MSMLFFKYLSVVGLARFPYKGEGLDPLLISQRKEIRPAGLVIVFGKAVGDVTVFRHVDSEARITVERRKPWLKL